MIINENILEFISETEEEFITNLLEGENEEIENFKKTLTHLKENILNEKKDYLEQFNKIKLDNLERHNDIYEKILRQITITILDKNWHSHIQELTNIRMSVSLSGYAGKDPVNEFRKSAFSAFNQLIYEIQKQIVLVLNNMNIQNKPNQEQKKEVEYHPPNKKIGRNDPCPCDSGKKYKHCHGNIALG
jgi:preprotein translocase subunit SecA